MANIRDLYYAKDSETVNQIPDSPTKTEPDSFFWYAAEKAVDSPSRSGAWLREKLDQIQGATEYTPDELHKMYPEADKGLFQASHTKRFAEYILERDRANQTLSMLKDYRSRDSIIPNWVRDVGYGALQNMGPLDIAAGAAIGAGVAYAAPAIGLGTIGASGTLTASIPQWAAIEGIAGGLTGTFGYLLDKQLEQKTQEKADPMQIPIGIGLGAIAGAGIGWYKNYYSKSSPGVRAAFDSAADEHLRGNGKIEIPEDQITRIPKGKFSFSYEEPKQFPPQGAPPKIETSLSGLLNGTHNPQGEVTLVGKLKYKTYSAAEYFPNDSKPGIKYALVNENSLMTHYGAEEPFAGATYLASTSGDLKAYSASINQGGRLVEIPTSDLKIANLSDPKTLQKVQNILEQYSSLLDGEIPKNLDGQEIIRFIAKQDTAEILQHDIMRALKQEGFDALTYKTRESLLGRVFSKEHTFLFDGPSGRGTKTIDSLNGSLGGLPESVILNNELKQKSFDLTKGEGIISNGKKISLDRFGYFDTDHFYGNEQSRVGYIEYFDKDHVDFIKDMIATNDISRLKEMVPQLQQETIDNLKNIKLYEDKLSELGLVSEDSPLAKMAKEDTKLYPEIVKATDFCFRRFGK